ncbi:MAG TPA: hypothetical protein PKA03_01945 [Tabrizicola sp.]|nr:hypothetical protein [Tabrizicola sp.]
MEHVEESLPRELLRRASIRGHEYAWRVSDIPEVIEATKRAGRISVGGQLQFRFPNNVTCECYWVEVDTFKSVAADLARKELVIQSANAALSAFEDLKSRFDFVAEGRSSFRTVFEEFESTGEEPEDAMWFVWYVGD